jgi:hypothetical protein
MALATRRIEAGELLQHVSRVVYRGKTLHYGRDGTNRYDAADKSFGVLYLGLTLPTALMESVFHKHRWDQDEQRSVALAEVCSRLVRVIGVLEGLQLADLTAPGVMAGHFGLNLEQLASRGYQHTQRISGELHALRAAVGAPAFDGVLYPSRNNYPEPAVALFERAAHTRSTSSTTSIWSTTWTGRVSSRTIASASNPTPGRRAPNPRKSSRAECR